MNDKIKEAIELLKGGGYYVYHYKEFFEFLNKAREIRYEIWNSDLRYLISTKKLWICTLISEIRGDNTASSYFLLFTAP